MAARIMLNWIARTLPVSVFPAVQLPQKPLNGLAMSEFGEFETDISASPRQMEGSLQREFGDDTQSEGDCAGSCREVPERDPALRRSQQSFR